MLCDLSLCSEDTRSVWTPIRKVIHLCAQLKASIYWQLVHTRQGILMSCVALFTLSPPHLVDGAKLQWSGFLQSSQRQPLPNLRPWQFMSDCWGNEPGRYCIGNVPLSPILRLVVIRVICIFSSDMWARPAICGWLCMPLDLCDPWLCQATRLCCNIEKTGYLAGYLVQ